MKINYELDENYYIIGYTTFPFDENLPYIDIESEEEIILGYTQILNNQLIYKTETYEQDMINKEKRFIREPLLIAFDKWEKAVLRGREDDSYVIMEWYQNILDLKEEALKNIPARIQYYMK